MMLSHVHKWPVLQDPYGTPLNCMLFEDACIEQNLINLEIKETENKSILFVKPLTSIYV